MTCNKNIVVRSNVNGRLGEFINLFICLLLKIQIDVIFPQKNREVYCIHIHHKV